MIVSIAELRAALGLMDSITAGHLALLNLIQPKGQAAVINALGYDPESRRATEYYPLDETAGLRLAASGDDTGRFETAGGRAVFVTSATREYLQLARLPVRTVHNLWIDNDGRFGQRSGAFSNPAWENGVDFYQEVERDGLCRSGCLIASTGWPVVPGSMKVDYTAGYSADEFSGRSTDGINAAGIHEAIMITTVNAFHQYLVKQKQARVGFVPGPVISERLGDYNYTLDQGSAAMMAQFSVNVPPAAMSKLAKFLHYGAGLT